MKYIKKFTTQEQYDETLGKGEIFTPNVSFVTGQGNVLYKPFAPPMYMIASHDCEIGFSRSGVYYSFDLVNWNPLPYSSSYIDVPAGQKIYFYADHLSTTKLGGMGNFSARINDNATTLDLGGNIMSMRFGLYYKGQFILNEGYEFIGLFGGLPIVDASQLELPATDLSQTFRCYERMFTNCNKLTKAPALPATRLCQYCYERMFDGCSSLQNAPALPATELEPYCYLEMFQSTGIITPPALPATLLAQGCYEGMFHFCRSMSVAPELPAPALVNDCYRYMFRYCSSLQRIKALYVRDDSEGTIGNYLWVEGVASSGTFIKAAGAEIPTGASGIPSGWTVEEVAV